MHRLLASRAPGGPVSSPPELPHSRSMASIRIVSPAVAVGSRAIYLLRTTNPSLPRVLSLLALTVSQVQEREAGCPLRTLAAPPPPQHHCLSTSTP